MTNFITKNVGTTLSKIGFQLKKHSPEILVGVGVAGTVATTVLACKATTKLSAILDETKTQVDQIHDVIESGRFPEEEYSKKDAQKDLVIVYRNSAINLIKLYGPSVLLGAASITCILKGHSILRARNIALAAAYATVDKGYKEYRNRVIERFGETVDRELKQNIKAEKITEIDEETGKKTKKTIEVSEAPDEYSTYARIFDESNPNWRKDAGFNQMFLRSQQQYANDLLISRGHLFLNEVYDMLNIPRTEAGQVVGWTYKKDGNPDGDNFVDFGIYDTHREVVRDFISGYERSIWLDFNVDGYILGELPK